MISIDDETTKELITVHGTPPIGSQVMKGPNSNGNVDGEVVSYSEHSQKVTCTVKGFMYGSRYKTRQTFSWGRNDQYEIQLKH